MKWNSVVKWVAVVLLSAFVIRKLVPFSAAVSIPLPAPFQRVSRVSRKFSALAATFRRYYEKVDSRIGSPLSRYLLLKRLLDVTVAASLLLFFAPLLGVLALLIRLDSAGSPIFAQQRVGTRVRVRNGVKQWELTAFTVYKFRTMRQNASSDLHKQFVQAFIQNDASTMSTLQNGNAPANVFKLVADPRITRVGRFLRKTSLDELPQLWNVLKGDMTLVGPRPPLPYEVDIYTPRHLRRLEATPGLTGLWQISARSTVDFEKMVELDIDYIEHPSFWADLKILFKTPIAVVWGKGAA